VKQPFPRGLFSGREPVSSHQNTRKDALPPDFDIDMGAPETEKAAVAIQSQFRKFQKKKQTVKS
uniref:Purkinje cell protein 4 n=1 Tax=Myripristis murdjan TaxID=586833 RepID=A0A667XHR2_9TELE